MTPMDPALEVAALRDAATRASRRATAVDRELAEEALEAAAGGISDLLDEGEAS